MVWLPHLLEPTPEEAGYLITNHQDIRLFYKDERVTDGTGRHSMALATGRPPCMGRAEGRAKSQEVQVSMTYHIG